MEDNSKTSGLDLMVRTGFRAGIIIIEKLHVNLGADFATLYEMGDIVYYTTMNLGFNINF